MKVSGATITLADNWSQWVILKTTCPKANGHGILKMGRLGRLDISKPVRKMAIGQSMMKKEILSENYFLKKVR